MRIIKFFQVFGSACIFFSLFFLSILDNTLKTGAGAGREKKMGKIYTVKAAKEEKAINLSAAKIQGEEILVPENVACLNISGEIFVEAEDEKV